MLKLQVRKHTFTIYEEKIMNNLKQKWNNLAKWQKISAGVIGVVVAIYMASYLYGKTVFNPQQCYALYGNRLFTAASLQALHVNSVGTILPPIIKHGVVNGAKKRIHECYMEGK